MSTRCPSLSRRLSLSIAAILVVVSLLFILFSYRLAQNDSMRLLDARAREYLDALAEILVDPLWSLNKDSVRDIGDSYAANELVAAISIQGKYGGIAYDRRRPGSNTAVTLSRTIERAGEDLGKVCIELTAEPYEARTREMLRSLLINLVITIGIVLILTTLLLRTLLKKPLQNLEDIVTGFARGQIVVPPERPYTEFRSTLAATAMMAERISSQMNALREAEKKYRSIFENAVEGIFQSTPEGKFLSANSSLARMLGYDSPADLIASVGNLSSHLYVNPSDRKRLKHILDQKGQVAGFEVDYYTKDRSIICCSLSALTIRDETGAPQHYEGTILDISARKEKEKAEREREIAEAASRTKSAFLANMSHEIRTPMNAIIGLTGLALRTELTTRQHDYLSKIFDAAKSLLVIINDILDYSKIEAGKMDIEYENFFLDKVLDIVADLLAIKCEEKKIEMLFNVQPDVPNVLVGDALRLGQVLTNLCTNAVKFTETGHVCIQVEVCQPGQDLPEGQVLIRFSVTDTGIGMTPDEQARLFQSFSQADASTTRKYGGSGLGLAISKSLVELMGGTIEVRSMPGKGSTFSFTARLGLGHDRRKTPQMAPESIRGKRALIVDDNAIAREILGDTLESFAFDVTLAASGEEALSKLLQARQAGSPFEIVLMDWKMPGLDGVTTTRLIRQQDGLASIPHILMVSAYGREEVIDEARNAGIKDFLVKPVSRSLLLDSILEAMGVLKAKAIRGRSRQPEIIPGIERIRGARVLLAEDNGINQQVVTELLGIVGLAVTVAEDGQQAVDAIHNAGNTPFDLVLMDLQMPVMDGYQAVEIIRQKLGMAELPIVALTAHAMKS